MRMPFLRQFTVPGGLTATRRAPGTEVYGDYVEGASSTYIAHPAIVYPASGRELEQLPEGQRTREVINVLTPREMLVAQDPAGNPGDLFQYQGGTYLIISSKYWQPGEFYQYLAVRQAA